MQAILNDKTDKTKGIIHLLVTPLCNRNCKYCCNKQYELSDIPLVTDEELKEAHTLCLTGGEPFLYTVPNEIARYYKTRYKNIKKIYVYTNTYEFMQAYPKSLDAIDGINFSIKNKKDLEEFENLIIDFPLDLPELVDMNNRVYVFDNIKLNISCVEEKGFKIIHRKWQKIFVPADDSIFRRI